MISVYQLSFVLGVEKCSEVTAVKEAKSRPAEDSAGQQELAESTALLVFIMWFLILAPLCFQCKDKFSER